MVFVIQRKPLAVRQGAVSMYLIVFQFFGVVAAVGQGTAVAFWAAGNAGVAAKQHQTVAEVVGAVHGQDLP